MKTWLKKLCVVLTGAAMVCSLILPVTAYAEEAEVKVTESPTDETPETPKTPTVTVTGVPTEPVYATSKVTLQVKAENLDPKEKYFVTVSVGTAYPFSVTVKNVSDADINNIEVGANAPAHSVNNGWSAKEVIVFSEQEGLTSTGENTAMGRRTVLRQRLTR